MLKRIPWRPAAGLIVLVATAVVFVDYIARHPELRRQLKDIPPGLLIGLLVLYFVFTASLAFINSAMVRLCKARLAAGEAVLLSMYSSIINFFGPLQSGPAFRAIYLKQKHGVKFKDYTSATLVYYFFYALFSGFFLFSGWLGWLILPFLAAVGIAITWLRRTDLNGLQSLKQLARGGWYYAAAATLLQVCVLATIYYVELRAIAPGIKLSQAIIYTGAANLALFVSLTPGAIGFRESFLVLSQNLHHVDGTTIVAANLIDRSVYILLLLVLVVAIFGSHAQKRLSVKPEPNAR